MLELRRTVIVTLVVGLVVLSIGYGSPTTQPSHSPQTKRPFTAAIIDPLFQQIPNSSFKDNVTSLLLGAGYRVDYYSYQDSTVDFFKKLPSLGYGLVIIRAHSGESFAVTSQPYDQGQYVWEQLENQLVPSIADGRTSEYFAITPDFVRQTMNGQFPNSLVVMMGCESLVKPLFADAFLARGASAFIGWNGPVNSREMDQATTVLIQSLASGNSPQQAVQSAMVTVGPDPIHGSLLLSYPDSNSHNILPAHQN